MSRNCCLGPVCGLECRRHKAIDSIDVRSLSVVEIVSNPDASGGSLSHTDNLIVGLFWRRWIFPAAMFFEGNQVAGSAGDHLVSFFTKKTHLVGIFGEIKNQRWVGPCQRRNVLSSPLQSGMNWNISSVTLKQAYKWKTRRGILKKKTSKETTEVTQMIVRRKSEKLST